MEWSQLKSFPIQRGILQIYGDGHSFHQLRLSSLSSLECHGRNLNGGVGLKFMVVDGGDNSFLPPMEGWRGLTLMK